MNIERCRRLIGDAISAFGLDLDGLTVLTEAATGYYALTAPTAALAGARRVLCLTKDSRHGTRSAASEAVLTLAQEWAVIDAIDVLPSRHDSAITDANIVTNLGFVRPIDGDLLHRLGPTAVVSLMWEPWEYRDEDLDRQGCRALGIPLLGTNEADPRLQTATYVGMVGLKLLLSLDVELFRASIAVVGNGEFADQVRLSLVANGADVHVLHPVEHGGLASAEALGVLSACDAVVVAEHRYSGQLLGADGGVDMRAVQECNPGLCVAHICGSVDRGFLDDLGFPCAPEQFRPPGYMSVTTDYVGPRPLIDLHAAGLKVGELLARARKDGLCGVDAEAAVTASTPLALGLG